jgi:hypothetical protein
MRKFTASFETTVGVIRVYEAPPPASFLLSMLVVADQGVASVRGLSAQGLLPSQCAAVRDRLRAEGFHTVEWTRRNAKTGRLRKVRVATGLAMDDPTVNRA